ncbi:MAG: YabP/YqfC family sporulation protein [Bacilli bacterium]
MQIVNNLRNYLLEEELKINVFKNKVNIVNYTNIDHFDNNKVIIKHKEGSILINGEKLVVSKLLIDEVLVEGLIKSIELR